MAGDIAIQAGGAVVNGIISSAFASSTAKKQRQLEEELTRLTLDQQKELQEHLQVVQGEVAKQKIVYDYLAQKNLQQVEGGIKSKRYTAYIVLGVSFTLLALVFYKLSKK